MIKALGIRQYFYLLTKNTSIQALKCVEENSQVLFMIMHTIFISLLKDECPVNALRAQNLAGGHFLGHEFVWFLYPSVSEQSLV